MKEGTKSMSFIGMMHNQNGIVAIADSKSTMFYSGMSEEEKERDTQKVFANNKFILLTCNSNRIIFNNGASITIEKIIKDKLNNEINDIDFIQEIYNYIQLNHNPQKDYCFEFFIGKQINYLDIPTNISYHIIINNKGLHQSPHSVGVGLSASGCHSQIVKTITVNNNWTIPEMIIKMNKLLNISIDLENIFKTYSAVGGNVRIISMDINGNIKKYINNKETDF